jgi:2,4-dienoyl-CoA reductase-like NADH-dependent reductase (Old Yellow Enzyme family)/thioredoxin reductase
MSLITSLVKRRQFLLGAVGSTCALTCKKLAAFAVANGAIPTSGSAAAEAQAASAAAAGAAIGKCPHLLSPLRIRNVILKNRIMHTVSPPHAMQGPENYPTDAYRNHYSNMAKNAAIVSLDTHFGSYPITYGDQKDMHNRTDHFSDHTWQDIPPVHNYLHRMIDDMHVEGALVRDASNLGDGGGAAGGGAPAGSGGAPGAAGGAAPGAGAGAAGGGTPGATGPGGMSGRPMGAPGQQQMGAPRQLQQDTRTVQEIVDQAKRTEARGFDVCDLGTTNLEAVQAVRNATNLVLLTHLGTIGPAMGPVSGDDTPLHSWDYEGGDLDWQFGKRTVGLTNDHQPTKDEIEQVVEEAKKLDGLADIFWIRDNRIEHPNSFTQNPDKPFNMYYAEALKKAGIKTLICPSAGFHDAAQNDAFIASGLTDMIGMATPFFADPEYVRKVAEGRLDDILPCIQCHNCHSISRTDGPWYDTCTVNPKWATPAYKIENIAAPTAKKKVAVIGGGVAGMRSAIIASERGHKVTIYERDKVLGGHMQFTDYTQWKWTYRKFKDYLVHQVDKHGVEVLLNTKATPEVIKAKGYDTVLVANGAQPVFSEWESSGAANIFNLMDSYTNKQALGKNIVVIGEGKFSTEAAIGMAKDGHKVMILCPSNELIELKFIGSHNMMDQIQILENHPNINFEVNSKVKSIKGNTVTYTDSKGAEKTLEAGSFVIWSGMKPRVDEAERFIGTADQVLFMGDCTGKAGTVQITQRQAFFMASQV